MKQRIRSCVAALKRYNYDSLLVSDPINVRYLTDFYPADGYLLITAAEELFYFTSFLYKQAAAKINLWQPVISNFSESVFDLLADKVKELNHKAVAFESKHLPFLEYKTIHNLFKKEGVSLVKTEDFLEKIRMVKTRKELSLIAESARITGETLQFAAEIFDAAMTEKDLNIEIDKFMRLKGDNELAFSSIVASGQNTVFPHHFSGDKKIGNDFFLIDLGSKYYGYCADLTRVFFWSKMPLLFRRIYDTVRKAQELSIGMVKDGVRAEAVDRAARNYIDKKGWGKFFGHGTGHGIGLSVHEPPLLRPGNKTILKEGMVVTVEPAIYFKRSFGVRIEDMVAVERSKGKILSGDINR